MRRAGFESLNKAADFYGLGLSLGNGEVRLLDLTNAYASLARGGVYKPVLFAANPIIRALGREARLFTPQTAYLLTDILADNNARAPAFGLNSPLFLPFPFAAKTGTSKDYKDNFAVGYTARWTVGVWVGNFNATSMQKVSGITGAGPILHDLAVYLQEKYPAEPFPVPDGIVRAPTCLDSGLLAGENCPHTQEGVFDAAHLPGVCPGKHKVVLQTLKITSPADKDIFKIDPSVPLASQAIKWQALCSTDNCTWKLDGHIQAGSACQNWWPLEVGKHTLSVSCHGETDSLTFEVLP